MSVNIGEEEVEIRLTLTTRRRLRKRVRRWSNNPKLTDAEENAMALSHESIFFL